MENKTNIWMIGSWKLHPHLYEARNSNERISIKPRLMRLLVFLLTNANTIVTKEQIYEAVWPGRIVSEDSLSKCISDLRKIIKQHFSPALKIETFRHVGYQLHADQDVKNGKESPVPLLQLSSTSQSWSKLSYIILAAMILLVCTSFWLLRTPDLETRPYHDLPISPVLTSKANEIDVSSSPDGKLLAYSKEENDVFGIYVKAIDQTGARLVSSSDYAVKQFPSWSADGTTLAYNCV
ncbi:MAG: winged helix-turn-helix domain-containing protein, partial [Saprospiraceae bacterium]|nr:winged helix-turn-helix domain-containing protein [Saprospiraceae bacterium]